MYRPPIDDLRFKKGFFTFSDSYWEKFQDAGGTLDDIKWLVAHPDAIRCLVETAHLENAA